MPGGHPDELRRRIERMTQSLVHRGPDDGDVWCDPETGMAFGHRRLSIIDLSPLGRQPMPSASGRYVICFNGEIYNFPALRRELEALGATFRGQSDTEVLLAAIEAWGLDRTLPKLEGMFAFGLWDRASRNLALVRDRLGIKPLFYRLLKNGGIAFASQPRALRGLEGEDAIDPEALAGYLRFNYVPAPYSIWRDIRKLRPGYLMRIAENAAAAPEPYWSLSAAVQAESAAGSLAEAKERLKYLLAESVKGHMISDVPIGSFLSGGVDSSLVTALMQQHSSRPVRSFTIGYQEKDYDESASASAIARHLGTEHTVLHLTDQEAMQVIPSLADIYDEPFADASQIATLLVSRLTRQHVTVALTGDGGDEGFAGYNRYIIAPLWLQTQAWPSWSRRALTAACTALSPAQWDFAARALPSFLRPPQFGEKMMKLAQTLNAPDIPSFYRALTYQWPQPDALASAEAPADMQSAELAGEDIVAYLQRLDAVGYLHDDVLTKVDRASMAVGLEARVPLLDHRIVSFGLALPRDYKLHGRTGKWLLRQVLDDYVPPELTDRPKSGFAVPIAKWLRGPLRDWAEDLLSEKALGETGLLHAQPIRQAWAEHLSGRANRQYGLWGILMLQAWQRHWL